MPPDPPLPATVHSHRSGIFAVAILATLCLVVGLFAVRLNARFYARSQPFYDSMSYHDQVHRVMTQARADGIVAALGTACRSSTVCLPLIVAALAGPFIDPSRTVGIAIQIVELAILCGTLWYYLHRVRGLAPGVAALTVTPCLLWRCLYDFNGGLSDFRMDLSLALLFTTTVLWYLIAIATGRVGHFVTLGIAASATCLFRATAPVYLALTLAPLVITDLVPNATRPRRLAGLGIAAVTAAAGCLWFFLMNYEALHYYYVVWNTDANAQLPLRESLRHVSFAVGHIGVPAAVLALTIPVVFGIDAWLVSRSSGALVPDRPWWQWSPDWRMAWIGVAPVLLLVARGAGLNPFVSMPAAFGLTMVLLGVGGGIPAWRPSRPALGLVVVFAIACTAATGFRGWKAHAGGSVDSMAAHRAALDSIVADAHRVGRDEVRVGTTHCFYFNQASLQSVALFDHPAAVWDGTEPRIDGVAIRPDGTFAVAAAADLVRVPGATVADKLEHMLTTAARDIDYLAIPDETTARYVQERMPFNVINRFAVTIRERLLESGHWAPVSDEIRNGVNEVVRLYRNTRRLAARSEVAGPLLNHGLDGAASRLRREAVWEVHEPRRLPAGVRIVFDEPVVGIWDRHVVFGSRRSQQGHVVDVLDLCPEVIDVLDDVAIVVEDPGVVFRCQEPHRVGRRNQRRPLRRQERDRILRRETEVHYVEISERKTGRGIGQPAHVADPRVRGAVSAEGVEGVEPIEPRIEGVAAGLLHADWDNPPAVDREGFYVEVDRAEQVLAIGRPAVLALRLETDVLEEHRDRVRDCGHCILHRNTIPDLTVSVHATRRTIYDSFS